MTEGTSVRWPSIAVVMTAYNAASTIARSLRSALAQSYEGELAVVVVDDGSTDRTRAEVLAVADPRTQLVSSGRVGRAAALNLALAHADGYELVANLDADDFMLPGRLKAQACRFVANPRLAVLGSSYYELHVEVGGSARCFVVSPPHTNQRIRRTMSTSFPICHSAATYRREAALAAGGFDVARRSRIDFDLWLRMAIQGGEVENLEEVLAVHIKRAGTFFDLQFSPRRSAVEMARLNFRAAQGLSLGARGYALAAARLVYSLVRQSSVKRQPRYGLELAGIPEAVSLAMDDPGEGVVRDVTPPTDESARA